MKVQKDLEKVKLAKQKTMNKENINVNDQVYNNDMDMKGNTKKMAQ